MLIRLGDALMLLSSRPIDQLEAAEDPDPQSPLIGGRSLARVRQHISLLAPTPLRIMILGDSGTGKELVARELHRLSGCSGPFIAINCAALPESLVETELFGHTRGAFSGAVRDKPGLFEAAQDGTLFLDEVAELPLASQAKLLRVVETGELRRVGALQSIHTSCRILCATNHNLEQDVERRLFRGDLAARLSEAEIQLPPLRDRVADIPLLAEYLGRRGGGKIGSRPRPWSPWPATAGR